MFVIAGASGLQSSWCAQGRAETPEQGKALPRRQLHGYENALNSLPWLACIQQGYFQHNLQESALKGAVVFPKAMTYGIGPVPA